MKTSPPPRSTSMWRWGPTGSACAARWMGWETGRARRRAIREARSKRPRPSGRGFGHNFMVSPAPQPQPDPRGQRLRKLRHQLDELVEMTSGLEHRLLDPGINGKQRRELNSLRLRYAREAVSMMMELDVLENDDAMDHDF